MSLQAKELFPGQYKPTPGHNFIRLLHDKGLLLRCFTQNIDSLEAEAGIPKEKIVAAHGNFDSASCIVTGEQVCIDEVRDAIMAGPTGVAAMNEKHGGLVKPDIVFFGEQLPDRFYQLAGIRHPSIPELRPGEPDFDKCDLLIVMGTSLVVQPFASLIDRVPKECPRLLLNREVPSCAKFNPVMALMGNDSGKCFSKVLHIVALHDSYTRALNCENLCQASALRTSRTTGISATLPTAMTRSKFLLPYIS